MQVHRLAVHLAALTLPLLSLSAQEAPKELPKGEQTPKAKAAQDPAPKAKPAAYPEDYPAPTLANVAYGPHERHVLDFWRAASDRPAPLVFVIHGGGWRSGSKELLSRSVDAPALLKAGISVVAINYRLMAHAQDVVPPVDAPMRDAARALQFVRSKAKEWNVDPLRIAAAGGSAGACTSLWLAYHDDLADPDNADPVARESTRLLCAAVTAPQTSLDPKQAKEWTPNSSYGGHAFGKANFAQYLADRDSILPWIAEYSPYALASKDDPPVYMIFSAPPAMGEPQRDPTHSANFGVALQQRCRELNIGCELVYPKAPDVAHGQPTSYLIEKLTAPK